MHFSISVVMNSSAWRRTMTFPLMGSCAILKPFEVPYFPLKFVPLFMRPESSCIIQVTLYRVTYCYYRNRFMCVQKLLFWMEKFIFAPPHTPPTLRGLEHPGLSCAGRVLQHSIQVQRSQRSRNFIRPILRHGGLNVFGHETHSI